MIDAVDEFWLQNIRNFKEKNFKSITKGKVDISNLKNIIKTNNNKKNNKINDLINVLKMELKDKISNVVISDRLTKSPIILIVFETGMDINMEKLMKMHNKTIPDSKKILEINPNHPMITKLSESLTKIDHKKLSFLLLDQANILDGNVLSNPSNYIESLTELFIKN
jgi:molecular chaperone HtpG